jgi:hypothetical protein
MVAFLTAVATTSGSPRVRRIVNRVSYGSCVAALVSIMLAVWFLFGRRYRIAGATKNFVDWSAPRTNVPTSNGDP